VYSTSPHRRFAAIGRDTFRLHYYISSSIFNSSSSRDVQGTFGYDTAQERQPN